LRTKPDTCCLWNAGINCTYRLSIKYKNAHIKVKNAFRVLDDVVVPHGNVIPLWMFGFLY